MLWEIDVFPREGDVDRAGKSVAEKAVELGISNVQVTTAHGYLVQGDFNENQIRQLAEQLFADPIAERFVVAKAGDAKLLTPSGGHGVTALPSQLVYVLPKPGVTDPPSASAVKAMADFGIQAEYVRTFKKYWFDGIDHTDLNRLCANLLANDAIEQVVIGVLPFDRLDFGSDYQFQLTTVPIRTMSDDELMVLSKQGQLYLSIAEMQTVQAYYKKEDRDPTDLELEIIAQTWSEHCSHKTLAGRIHYRGVGGEKRYENMLKETIFAATQEIRKMRGDDDLCVSVFVDNAGVVRFDDEYNVCFKGETHNHPSAVEPYGGAHTGIGGLVRDIMGTGLAAKPVACTDVCCLGELDMSDDEVPPGSLHPRRIMRGAVYGVRDYANRMGIPTINGAVYFDKRYVSNPLVYCGGIGLIPRDMSFGEAKPGDLVVAMGARTGRDGIHGATFSSVELMSESDNEANGAVQITGGAVQIGDAVTQKMMLDVLLEARDRRLFNAITDCGAGGFSSAVGEMGEKIGVDVDLENAPLKYPGLNYTEIWISEAQERMVLAVPPDKWPELKQLCDNESVEATVLGTYKPTSREQCDPPTREQCDPPSARLHLKYHGTTVANLDMKFLHKGRPPVVRDAVYEGGGNRDNNLAPIPYPLSPISSLLKILASPNVASKHWVIRQYDYEAQGGSVIKPLVGAKNNCGSHCSHSGPGDASVFRPRLDSMRGLVVACGMNPYYGDYDTYHMTASGIDEAIRNCVAVGADPSTIVLLDNFCWGNTERPETLGSLVRAAQACYDYSVAFMTPFISGKDSLNNEFRPEGGESIAIPPSLLISAMGQVDHVSQSITMDLKSPGNLLYIVGLTHDELGGSHFALVNDLTGGNVPKVDAALARSTFEKLHAAIKSGVVRSCHDLSEGGLAVSIAEMCFAGRLGANISLDNLPFKIGADTMTNADIVKLFSESNSRFVCEVTPENAAKFETAMQGIPFAQLGVVTDDKQLTVTSAAQTVIAQPIDDLYAAWHSPLDF